PGIGHADAHGWTRVGARGFAAGYATAIVTCESLWVEGFHAPQPSSTGYSAAMLGVNSSGNPLWPVNLSPSSYISKARFFNAGRTEAILSRSRSAAIPG